MLGKKWWSPIFGKYSYCYKMGHFCPNLGPKNLIVLFLESTLKIFLNFVWWWDIIAISKILNGIPPNMSFLGKWAMWAWFGPKLWNLSICSKYFYWNFAVWYSTIASQEWFKYAQESLDFSESTALLFLFMWSLLIQQLHVQSQQ